MANLAVRHIALKVCSALVVITILGSVALAQGNVTLTIDGLQVVSGQKMQAFVTVRDENGVPVMGLTRDNFAIIEDQRTYYPPESVEMRNNPEAGLSVALVIDLSSNMRGQPLVEAKAASRQLLESLLSQPNDPDQAAFFGITEAVDLSALDVRPDKAEVAFTKDRNILLNMINGLDVPGTQSKPTPLYDALFRVIKLVGRQKGPRAIVVLTDGQDPNVSKLSADDPISEANRNNIPIFPIGFSQSRIDEAYLQRLAARTGGTYARSANAGEFSKHFQAILDKLGQQYVLTYTSQLTPDAQPHAVIIRLDSPKGKASDDEIFTFMSIPTAPQGTPTVGGGFDATKPISITVTPRSGGVTPGSPAPKVTPAPTPSWQERISSLVKDRKNLPLLLGGAGAVLLLVLLILILIIFRRQRAQAEENEPWTHPYPSVPGATVPGSGEPAVKGGSSPTLPTVPGGRPSEPGNELPTELGSFTSSQSTSSSQPTQGPTGFSADTGGATMIIRRTSQVSPLAMLVSRAQPQESYPLAGASTAIGRDSGNQIRLQHGTISRQHAKITSEGGDYRLYDLGSANGTFVNDKKVSAPVTLAHGDIIRFGEVEFTYQRSA